jgi:hypothetical protein
MGLIHSSLPKSTGLALIINPHVIVAGYPSYLHRLHNICSFTNSSWAFPLMREMVCGKLGSGTANQGHGN